MKVRIMIAESSSMIRERIKHFIQLEEDIEVIYEAFNADRAIAMLRKQLPDVLFLNINIPGKTGFEVLRFINSRKLNVRVILLTTYDELDYLVKEYDIKCDGYVSKDANPKLLKKSIHIVYNEGTYIQPAFESIFNNEYSVKKRNKEKVNKELTKRETEILKLLVEGLMNKEIALRLDISERTVKNHISNIFMKINVSDRTQAAVFAIKYNLVEINPEN